METATNVPAGSYALATQPDKEASSAEKTPKSDGQYFILKRKETVPRKCASQPKGGNCSVSHRLPKAGPSTLP